MKKILGIGIALIFILTGCSSVKNTSTPTVNTTAASSTSSSNNQQSQLQSENNSKNDNSTNLLNNIDTSKSQYEKGYYDYRGNINNMAIHMSIYPLEADMVGSYLYDGKKVEIKLKGKAGEKDIILYEYDDTGKNTGIFKGTMDTVDKIEGTWISSDGKQSYPFKLSLASNIPGAEYGKRYQIALSSKSDADVDRFVSEIQDYVIKDNKEQLAEHISYPITAKINGKSVKIQNKNDFIKNYNGIFHADYKKAISEACTKYLFVNFQGIMFGEGQYNIWINENNSKLMITAINN